MERTILSPDVIDKIKANIFPAAHDAIGDWQTFPWHRQRTEVTTSRWQSSQACAIDIFGTLKSSVQLERDRVLDALCGAWALAPGGPWNVELEWSDPENVLCEKRLTQVDAVLTGANTRILVECKFTEPGGGTCSQPRVRPLAEDRLFRQCNGTYAMQTNPESGVAAMCALTGKGIKYWDYIPKVFGLDAARSRVPCPFAGHNFQWMRNLVLAEALTLRPAGLPTVVLVVFADVAGLSFPNEIASGRWGDFVASLLGDRRRIYVASYQELTRMMTEHSPTTSISKWRRLAEHLDAKFVRASQRLTSAKT